jgi:hypothetical protein
VKTGSCLCGGVSFEISGPLRPVVGCHCSQCRKQSGHFGAFTACDDKDLKFRADKTLAWYRASNSACRGFCNTCGSLLFWKGDGGNYTSIAAGSLDGATGLKIEGHIFCADKGDYYDLLDGDYQRAQWS